MMHLTGVFFFILQMFRLLLGLKPMDERENKMDDKDDKALRFGEIPVSMGHLDEPPVSNPVIPPPEPGVEQVLCVPADMLEFLDIKDKGVWSRHVKDGEIPSAVSELCREAVFVNRPHAEDPSSGFVQLIPYCIIVRGREMFRYRRKGSEGRLTGLFSCGVGGHINPVDSDSEQGMYEAALRRELREELGLENPNVSPAQAIIYDDGNEVGKVHLGIVHVVNIGLQQKLTFNDPALEQGEFWPISELVFNARADKDLYETWTQLVLGKVYS